LMQLDPVSFYMKDRPGLQEYGFIAQDVETVYPALVMKGAKPEEYRSMNYIGLIAPIVQGLQELKVENDQLKAANQALEARLRRLEQRMDKAIR